MCFQLQTPNLPLAVRTLNLPPIVYPKYVVDVLLLYFLSMLWMTVEGYALYEATVKVYDSRITGNFLRFTAVVNPLLAAAIITGTFLTRENFYDTAVL